MRSEDGAAARWWGRRLEPADLRHDANIFTIIRWVLASAVMFSHGFDLTAVPGTPDLDPSGQVLPFKVSRLAVLLFFSLSGFLVAGSLIKRGARDFAVARALRLLPGLWVSLVVTIIVLGLFFNVGTIGDLMVSTSAREFLIYNAALLGGAYKLDGIFTDVPIPTLINGSLWTIPQEVRCYVALGLVGLVGLLTHRRLLAIAFVIALVINYFVPKDIIAALVQPRPLASAFFFGVLMYLWRDKLLLSWPLALALAIATALIEDRRLAAALFPLASAYAALVVAILVPATWKRISATLPDYSYGIYIYAFPAQQAAISLGIGTTPYTNMISSLAITIIFAAASWHWVEKPALGLKPRFTRTRVAVDLKA